MKSGIPGHGAVSIILIFTVLCLTMFAVITFTQAGNDKALADAARHMVVNYYEADTLAERVLAELCLGEEDKSVLGVDITVTDSNVVCFSIPVTENKELVVEAVIRLDDYEILVWKMADICVWEPDIYHPLPGADEPLFFDFGVKHDRRKNDGRKYDGRKYDRSDALSAARS